MNAHKLSKNIGLVKCRCCNKIKTRIRSERAPTSQWVYRDEAGKRWNRLQCNDCAKKWRKNYSRENLLHQDRSQLRDHKNALGFKSESVSKALFESLGFVVDQSSAHGPDLVLHKNNIQYTCEVRTAVLYKNLDCWFTPPVYPNRKKDDLIAIVMPSGQIHIEPMAEHLNNCSPSGRRSITNIVRAYRNESLNTQKDS